MPKTTLAEIKHLIHKNKAKNEQNIFEENSLELAKVSFEESSISTTFPSKDTNENIIVQNQKVGITDKSNDNQAIHISVSAKDKTKLHEKKLYFAPFQAESYPYHQNTKKCYGKLKEILQ